MPFIDADSIGPVDVAVIGFVGDEFHGEIAPALRELVAAGTVRIIDLAFVRKAADGTTTAVEIADSDLAEVFGGLDDEQNDLLNEDDLQLVADSLEPATAALVIVWANSWAATFAQAVRDANGFLVSQERIPYAVVAQAVAALQND
jgi:hypothetical protein